MKQTLTVMRFEFLTFAKSKAFIGVTVFMIALGLIGPAVPQIVQLISQRTPQRRVAVVDHTGQFNAQVLEDSIFTKTSLFTDINAAKTAITEGRYHYAVEIWEDRYTMHVTAMGMRIFDMQHQFDAMLRARHQTDAFYAAGLSAAAVMEILLFTPQSEVLTIGEDAAGVDAPGNFMENVTYVYVLTLLLYMVLLIGAQYIVTSVVREKSTKTMELLITSCKAHRLLNGKVFGVGLAILLKLTLTSIAALASMAAIRALTEDSADVFIVNIPPDILALLLVFFLLGFILYSYIYAALASTVSRMEDAASTSHLPTFLIIAALIGAMFGMTNPGAGWVSFMSHIPFFSPFIMFLRYCMGTAPLWEVGISIGVMAATVIALAWLGGRIYRMGTLMYGNKPKIKDLVAAFR